MIGRAKEWERALRLTAQIDDGPCLLMIDGPAGIGKTTLHEAVVTHVAANGATVLRCRPSQSEMGLARSGLLQLMDGVDEETIDAIPAPQRRAMRIALRWDAPSGGRIEAQTLSAALTSVLRGVAAHGRLLVAVDDMQWLDSTTADALIHAVKRLDDLPVAVIATSRTPRGRDVHPIDRTVDPDRIERIDMGPLPAATLRTVLAERLQLTVLQSDAARIARAAEGNPFVALELGRLVAVGGMPSNDEPLPVPDDVRDLVTRRLKKLPADTRLALIDASAMATPTTPPLDMFALASAEAAGIITISSDRRVVFTHPLYESAIYTSVPLAKRLAIHLRLAQDVEDSEERAHHLALATKDPDSRVATLIAAAADDALNRGGFDQAIRLAERAWQLTPTSESDVKAHRAVDWAEVTLRAGRAADAIEVVDRILPDLEGTTRGRALLIAGEARMWTDSPADAVATLTDALESLENDPASAALAHLDLTFLYHQVLGDWMEGTRHAATALALCETAGPDAPFAEALATNALAEFFLGAGFDRATLDRAVAAADPRRALAAYFRPDAIRAILTGYADDIGQALTWFDAEVTRAHTLGRSSDMALLSLVGIPLAALHGDRDLMERWVAAGRDGAGDIGSSMLVTLSQRLCELSLLMHTCDRTDESVRKVRDGALELTYRCEQSGNAYLMLWLPAWVGAFEVAMGNAEGALTWLEPLLELAETPDVPFEPSGLTWIPNSCEALILAGQHDRARAIIDRYETQCRRLDRTWTTGAIRRARAVLLAAEGELADAATEAADAAAILDSTGFRLEAGRAHLVCGQIHRRQRRRADARSELERAHAIFTDAGCTVWARFADDERNRTWAPSVSGVLTASEAQMAQMAAQGTSNPDIARVLFVSRRTVEATLSRVYRKLGVTGRPELAAALRSDEPSEGAHRLG